MTSTQNTLRARQNMEVLDVFKNLNSQVNAITKRQVAVFPDTLKPKTQRDLEVEVNVDKSVEGLNNLLETRLISLEFVLKNDAQLTDLASRPRRRVVFPAPRPLPAPSVSSSSSSASASSSSSSAPRKMVIEDDIVIEDEAEDGKAEAEDEIDFLSLTTKAEREKAEAKFKANRKLEAERRKREGEEAERRGEAMGRKEQQGVLKLVPFQRAYDEIINTGSAVSLWNNIVRFYQKVGLSRQSQEMVKVRVQELTPNLEALLYGLGEAVDVLFSSNQYNEKVGLKVLELLRTQSIYQIIRTQVDTSVFELVSVSSMETAFKNIFESLSQDRRELLDKVASRGDVAVKPIRLIPEFRSENFNQRIKALADEMGLSVRNIPAPLMERLRGMNQKDFEKYADEAIRAVKSKKSQYSAEDDKTISDTQQLQVQISELTHRAVDEIPIEIYRLQQNIVLLDGDYKADDVGVEERVEVPPLPIMPDRLDFDDDDDEGFDRAMEEWGRIRAEYDRANELNDQIDNDNMMADALRGFDEAGKQELKNDMLRQIKLLEDERDALDLQIPVLEQKRNDKLMNMSVRRNLRPDFLKQALVTIVKAYQFQRTRGKGKPVDSRGLAGMGSHYGTASDDESEDSESGEESEEDEPMRFDDRRNDMYYSRPIRRK